MWTQNIDWNPNDLDFVGGIGFGTPELVMVYAGATTINITHHSTSYVKFVVW